MTAAPTNKAEAAALLENLALLDFSDHVEQLRYITLSYVSCGKGVMRRVATLTGATSPVQGVEKILVIYKSPRTSNSLMMHVIQYWVDDVFEQYAAKLGVYLLHSHTVEL